MPEAKKRRRRCTSVVVKLPTTVPITPEDYELAVHTIARMIAQWWDAIILALAERLSRGRWTSGVRFVDSD